MGKINQFSGAFFTLVEISNSLPRREALHGLVFSRTYPFVLDPSSYRKQLHESPLRPLNEN